MSYELKDSYTTYTAGYYHLVLSTDFRAQTFKAGSSYSMAAVKLVLQHNHSSTGYDTTVRLFAVDGGGEPTGDALATGTIAAASVPYSGSSEAWIECVFDTPYSVVADTTYAIVVSYASSSYSVRVYFDNAAGYANGTMWRWRSSTGWVDQSKDAAFETYGGVAAVTYVDMAVTGGGTGGGSAVLLSGKVVNMAVTGGGTGGGSANLLTGRIANTPYNQVRRLVAVGNNQLWYEDA
jgi:hypothetical protein